MAPPTSGPANLPHGAAKAMASARGPTPRAPVADRVTTPPERGGPRPPGTNTFPGSFDSDQEWKNINKWIGDISSWVRFDGTGDYPAVTPPGPDSQLLKALAFDLSYTDAAEFDLAHRLRLLGSSIFGQIGRAHV